MDVLILLLFVSAILVAGAVLLFLRGIGSGDFEHGDRLALLPLESEESEAVTREAKGRRFRSPPNPEEEMHPS